MKSIILEGFHSQIFISFAFLGMMGTLGMTKRDNERKMSRRILEVIGSKNTKSTKKG